MQGIALNLLPILTREFRIAVYAVPYDEAERPAQGGEQAVMRQLNEGGGYQPYWTMFEPFEGARRLELGPSDNTYATLDCRDSGIEGGAACWC